MKKLSKGMRIICVVVTICFSLAAASGCATKGQTGALAGAGAGALIGGLANTGGSWGATALIGAGVGAGVGYLIGNEQDKKDAENRQKATEAELKPLAGTTWQVISINHFFCPGRRGFDGRGGHPQRRSAGCGPVAKSQG